MLTRKMRDPRAWKQPRRSEWWLIQCDVAPWGCSIALIGGLVCQTAAGFTWTEFIVGQTSAVVKSWKHELEFPGGQVLIVATLNCVFQGHAGSSLGMWSVFSQYGVCFSFCGMP